MSNELAKHGTGIDESALSIVKARTAGVFLKLANGSSDVVKQGLLPVGHFFITNQDINKSIPIGKIQVDPSDNKRKCFLNCKVLIARPHALRLVNAEKKEESFDINGETFQMIKNRYDRKMEDKNNGEACNYGYDQLLYIPYDQLNFAGIPDQSYVAEAQEAFADGAIGIFFFNRTAAQYAPCKRKITVGTDVTIKSVYIDKAKVPFWSPQDIDMLKEPIVNDKLDKYLNDIAVSFKNPGGGVAVEDAGPSIAR